MPFREFREKWTLTNCNNRELGSRDVVIRIRGSRIPALAYSSSMLTSDRRREKKR